MSAPDKAGNGGPNSGVATGRVSPAPAPALADPVGGFNAFDVDFSKMSRGIVMVGAVALFQEVDSAVLRCGVAVFSVALLGFDYYRKKAIST